MIRWYYAHPKTRQQVGPCDEAQVRDLFASGALPPSTLVWHEGLPDWVPAREAFLAYDPAFSPDRAPVPPRLVGWIYFDAVMLWFHVVVQFFLFLPLAIASAVAAVALFGVAGTLSRLPSIPAESEPLFIRLRRFFAAVGWGAVCVIVFILLIVVLCQLGILSPYLPEFSVQHS